MLHYFPSCFAIESAEGLTLYAPASVFSVSGLSFWCKSTFLCSGLTSLVGSSCWLLVIPAHTVVWSGGCQVSPAATTRHGHTVKKGKAPTINQYLSSFNHLFRSRNLSEPEMPTSLLIWVQTVQMASVSVMSILGLALGREHLLLGAESLSLA